MKLLFPLEHRIQLKADQYSDSELQAAALEVHELKEDIKEMRALQAAKRTECLILYAIIGATVGSILAVWMKSWGMHL